jgi:hypothetical protein
MGFIITKGLLSPDLIVKGYLGVSPEPEVKRGGGAGGWLWRNAPTRWQLPPMPGLGAIVRADGLGNLVKIGTATVTVSGGGSGIAEAERSTEADPFQGGVRLDLWKLHKHKEMIRRETDRTLRHEKKVLRKRERQLKEKFDEELEHQRQLARRRSRAKRRGKARAKAEYLQRLQTTQCYARLYTAQAFEKLRPKLAGHEVVTQEIRINGDQALTLIVAISSAPLPEGGEDVVLTEPAVGVT